MIGGFSDVYLRTNKRKYPAFANFLNDISYNLTGYDFLGTWKPDYYGKNIQRQIATALSSPRQAAYDAAAQQIAKQYSKARENVNISAMNRGLARSGFTAEQERELAGQEAMAVSNVWADLLQQEQNFLDNLYMQNKDIALKLALQERNEALIRQIQFQNFINQFNPLNKLEQNKNDIVSLLSLLLKSV